MTGLKEWLTSLQLESYYERLAEQRVDLDVLAELSEPDLVELGMPLGDRKRMMRGIRALRRGETSAPEAPHLAPGAGDEGLAEASRQPPAVQEYKEQLRQLTLLFADLVGSTQLARSLDIEGYRDAIRTYQLCCSDAVRAHFGFVAQFLGDGVVAYFGYPTAEEDDAERAVATGLDIARGVGRLPPAGGVRLAARIGIATGDVLIGDIVGDRLAMKAAALGETPNLAARLQTLAEPGQVLVSGRTRRLLGSQFDCVPLGDYDIKGFAQPQEVWLVRGMELGASRFSARLRGPITPFVGREEECEILHHRWSSTTQGEGQVVLISGEAGIGKSRLAEWLSEAIADQPQFRLSYQCSPYHTGSALYPIVMQIARAAGFQEGDDADERLDKLERLIAQGTRDVEETAPLFAHLLSVPFEHRYGSLDIPPEVVRERTAELLIDQAFGLAEQRPVLIFFEDLHWIDPSTEELLDMLVERIGDRRILLLCTYRPEYEAPWVGRAGITHLSLSRLDRRRSLEIARRLSADEELPDDVLGQIVERTEGVPLFLEEMTKAVLENRRLSRNGLATGISLPATLKDLLMAKLDSLSSARDVVPICAAIGRSFSYRLLLAVSGLRETALRPVLDQLVHAQILLSRGEYPGATLTFRHALIQEAAYETILASRARALHARIADVLKAQFADVAEAHPEVVAQHLSRAGRAAEARDQWRAAAEQAIARSANVEAVRHLEAALSENAALPPSEETVEAEIAIRKRLSVPLEARYWGSDDITGNLERLGQLLRERGSESDLFVVLHGLGGEHLIAGEAARAREIAEQMLPIAGGRDGEGVRAVLTQHCLGMSEFFLGHFGEAVGHFDRSIALSPSVPLEEVHRFYVADPRLVGMAMRAWALALAGQAEEARTAAARVLSAAETCAHDFTRTYAYAIEACVQQALEDGGAALAAAERALEISRRMDFRYWEAWAQIMRGWALAATGDPSRGAGELVKGLDKYTATGSRQIVRYAKALLADIHLRAKRIEAGLLVVDELERDEGVPGARFFDAHGERIAAALRSAAINGGNGGTAGPP